MVTNVGTGLNQLQTESFAVNIQLNLQLEMSALRGR